VISYSRLLSPKELSDGYPVTEKVMDVVCNGRKEVEEILDGNDLRKLIIVGPCSIHDVGLAIEYAEKLKNLSEKVGDKFVLVMRAYFEKPRSVIGWNGFLTDPYLDGSNKMQEGLVMARKLLLKIGEMGVLAGTEFLNPVTPSYIGDLISWAAIGARTAESETHRQMASGLMMPVGFKNGTSGDLDVGINGMKSSTAPHSFFGIGSDGFVSQVDTHGNPYGHFILRGGNGVTNYDSESVVGAQDRLKELGVPPRVIVDCSHGNSGKDYKMQPKVFADVIEQVLAGNDNIVGMMLESNLKEGSQKISPETKDNLEKGVSITDGCIGWNETEEIILAAYDKLV